MLLDLLQRCQYGGTFTFINAPGEGKRVNCKLDRTMAWDDDEDMDLARSLKICPILVDACGIKEGEELAWPSVFSDSRGRGSGFLAAAAAAVAAATAAPLTLPRRLATVVAVAPAFRTLASGGGRGRCCSGRGGDGGRGRCCGAGGSGHGRSSGRGAGGGERGGGRCWPPAPRPWGCGADCHNGGCGRESFQTFASGGGRGSGSAAAASAVVAAATTATLPLPWRLATVVAVAPAFWTLASGGGRGRGCAGGG